MNSKERLFNNINGVKTDRQACICPGGMMNMIITGLMEESKVYLPAAHSDAPYDGRPCKAGISFRVL